jgi:ring-1,2-phenylacetyl-CoA epoxidase subunit PaaC
VNENQHARLAARLLELADDELILAHRNSEWCGHAPILEEDIAFANLALDELGHAILWYRLHAELTGQDPDTTPDQLVYFREPFEYRAAQFCALPKGDWAFSMLRQFLWDVLEDVRLEAFAGAALRPLAETAAKIRTEEVYHIRHTAAWVKRLGLGTDESNTRMQAALDLLWPYTGELTGGTSVNWGEYGLPADAEIRAGWEARVRECLVEAGLTVPETALMTLDRDLQSGYIVEILADLQQVARLDPQAGW